MENNSPEWLAELRFERIDRADFVLDELFEGTPEDAVEQLALAITDEFRVRRELSKGDPRYIGPMKWLKPVCYHAILTCMHLELFDTLAARIERHGRLVRGPKVERSIFMEGLVGIFAHDKAQIEMQGTSKKRSRTLTSEKDRERLANAMWWGFRHYVTPQELNAFNRQHPYHRTGPNYPKMVLICSLADSVVERRARADFFKGGIEHERGHYTDDINEGVSARRKKIYREKRRKPIDPDDEW